MKVFFEGVSDTETQGNLSYTILKMGQTPCILVTDVPQHSYGLNEGLQVLFEQLLIKISAALTSPSAATSQSLTAT